MLLCCFTQCIFIKTEHSVPFLQQRVVVTWGGGSETVCPRGGDLLQGTCRSLSDNLDRGAVTGLNMKGS